MNPVQELTLSLGIHSTYKGHHYLVSALELALENEDTLIFMTKRIFPIVASQYNTNVHCVERNIRTIIRRCWNSPYKKVLQSLTPCQLYKPPSVSEFVDILFLNLKTQYIKRKSYTEHITVIKTETSIITKKTVITEKEVPRPRSDFFQFYN